MGVFASIADVQARFEGTLPAAKVAPGNWVDVRINDVEAALIGRVPSLGVPGAQIDPGRLAQAKSLVCDKVLDLYRNPERYSQRNQALGQISAGGTFAAPPAIAIITFTPDELRPLRQRKLRANLGTAAVKPWHPQPRPFYIAGPKPPGATPQNPDNPWESDLWP